jgi:hypothetical protein
VPIVAPVVRRHYRHSTTVTRTTTVRSGVVAAAPVYDELKRGPRLYDVATPAAVAPAVQPAVPAAIRQPGILREAARRPNLFEHARTASLKIHEQKAD